MDKYYFVPVTTDNIKINGRTLLEILEMVDKELYDRELKRIEITYENPKCKYLQESGLIDEYNNNTRLLYRKRKVPEKIIIKENKRGLFEYISECEIVCDDRSFLSVYEANIEDIKNCIYNSLYDKTVLKFVEFAFKEQKSKFKRKNSVKRGK